MIPAAIHTDTVYFAAGCFWCVEAVYTELEGVYSVESGYTGGKTYKPTYEEVCTGLTGHAEAVQIVYDPEKISFKTLLEVFWQTHDPTTLNRQGADAGTQYRSAIFFTNVAQQEQALFYKKQLDLSGAFAKPIVTEIQAFDGKFFPAENYHQNYFSQNPNQPYCTFVIRPKMEKFRKAFHGHLKKP
ncbi:MAG: peptide-methionine (S)-S-oxide reductase MsrA [Bacteroidia bacterium]|jgi:peptide-methionine (S)-S-oxide reductase|nr:peptide-methionine (S)-S-oxide reductase MsrA [Bacteroidia bacterium]MCC6769166.1 peptide-methionine (S)-S-oxide reductase MsrA [Bacteroidia bacterium]